MFIVLFFIGGYFGYQHFFGNEEEKEVLTAEVALGDIEDLVTATGKIEPKEFVDVGAQVSGQVMQILVSVGDEVKRGDLLANIDATVYEAKVDAIKAQLRYQEAQKLDRQAQYDNAKRRYERQQRLFEALAITQEELETSELNYKSAKASLMMIQAQMDQTNSSLREEIANLEYTTIYAPMDGTVVSIPVREGQTINANQQTPTILTIADLSVMRVQAEVSEADIGKLKKGMKVYFNTMGSRQRYYSNLDLIEPTPIVSNNVVNYKAVFDIENKRSALMPQMTAQVFFVVKEAKDTLLIPVSAIAFSTPARDTGVVKLIDASGIQDQKVKVGVTDRVNAQILDGLKSGDEVVMVNRNSGSSSTQRQRP